MKQILAILLLTVSAAYAQHLQPNSAGHGLPTANGSYDWGSTDYRWRTLYGVTANLLDGGVALTIDCAAEGQVSGLELYEIGTMKWGIINRSGDDDTLYFYPALGIENPALTLSQGGNLTLNGDAPTIRIHSTNSWTDTTPIAILFEQPAGSGVGTQPLATIKSGRETTSGENSRGYLAFGTDNNLTETTEWMRLNSLGFLSGTFKLQTTPSSVQALSAGDLITYSATKVRVRGAGGPVTLTSTPTIAAGADGQLLIIQGADDTNTLTVQDAGTLPGSLLEIGAASRALGKGDVLVLTYDSTDGVWYEVSFTNN